MRIDDALVDTMLFSIAHGSADRSWVGEMKAHRANAPDEELAWIDRALAWAEHPFSPSNDPVYIAREIGNGFAHVYPTDECLASIVVDVDPAARTDARVDAFERCFPRLARAHLYAGERCDRFPERPEAREEQLLACAKSLARCIQLGTLPDCARELGELQGEWLAPYCTTATLTPKIRAEHPGEPALFLDLADFAYGVQRKTGVDLLLSPRGRRRVQSWFALQKPAATSASLTVTTRVGTVPTNVSADAYAVRLISPTVEDVCDHIQRRDVSQFP